MARTPRSRQARDATPATLDAISRGQTTVEQAMANGRITIDGDKTRLTQLLGLLDTFELMFNIVEP